MKKTVRTIAIYIFAAVLAVFCLFTASAQSFLYARADNALTFDGTNVLDDLEGATIDGEPFRLEDYNFDERKELRVISFVEYGYSFRSDRQQNYALYIYIYNPQGFSFDDDSELNYLQMSYSGDDYAKYPLKFLNKSTTAGYEGMFYKYKLNLTVSQSQTILNDLNSNERIYKVSGIELLKVGDYNATEFEVANAYTYTGYSLGYGAESATESSLNCTSNGFETLTLDVHGAAYTPDGTNGENNYTQDMLHSVYFAVPNEVVNEYGGISKIYAQWLNAITQPIFVTDTTEVYYALVADLGKEIPDYSDYREEQPYGFRSDIAIYNCYEALNTGELINTLYYEFLATDENSYVNDYGQYVLSGDVVLDYIKDYSSKHQPSSGELVGNKYKPELFSEYDTEYTYVEIEADDEYSLTSQKLTQNFWEIIFNRPGTVIDDSVFENINAIYQVNASDVSSDIERTCENLYINKSYYDEFKAFYDNAVANDQTVYIFRYYQSEYKCDIAEALKWVGTLLQPELTQLIRGNHYVAQTHVTIDFDIIKVRFTKGTVNTEIPIVMSPVDFVPDLEPPIINKEVPWFTVVIILIVSVAGIAVPRIIKHYTSQIKTGGKRA